MAERLNRGREWDIVEEVVTCVQKYADEAKIEERTQGEIRWPTGVYRSTNPGEGRGAHPQAFQVSTGLL